MAKTFTLNSKGGYGTYQGRYLQLTCTQTSDVAANKSRIDWTLSSLGGESSYYQTGPTTVEIAGVRVYYCRLLKWDAKVFPVAKGSTSGSLVVDHGSDGSKAVSVKLSTSVWYGTVSEFKGTWTLDSIPRQALITAASDFTDVDNPSISFSNPGDFLMNVWLEPNPIGDHLCVRENIPNTGSYTWELTAAEREALRKSCPGKTCPIRLGLYSYVGGVEYSDYKDKTYKMTENPATRPFVDAEVSPNNGQLPSAFAGMYIQGKTKLNISLSAQGKHGASIKSYSAVLEGKTYSGQNIETSAIQGSGNVVVSCYASDSREFTGSDSVQISVLEYSKPLVVPADGENAIVCYRSDGNGKRVSGSTSVWIKAKRTHHSLSGKNACVLQWRRKLSTEEWNDAVHTWSDLSAKSTLDLQYNTLLVGYVFDVKKAYTVQIRAIDDVGEEDVKTFEIPTQDVALHLGKGGKNVSVGTYCDYLEDYTFRSAWKAIFDDEVVVGGMTLADYIKSVINRGG